MTTNLFTPYDLASLTLPNRVVMAPMTRTRADDDGVPGPLAVEYYTQRASAGLIVTECTAIAPDSAGIIHAPGIFSAEQVEGWRHVVAGVHDAGGRINLQVWHCGRISHPSLQPGGADPVAPSAVAAQGQIFTPSGPVPYTVPRPLELDEIAPLVEAFGRATSNARGRIRRGGTAWRVRLPAGPIPAKRDQPAHGPLRRFRGEPRPLPAGSGGRHDGRLDARARGRQALAVEPPLRPAR